MGVPPDRSFDVRAVVMHKYKGNFAGGDTLTITSEATSCDLDYRLLGEYVLFFAETGKQCRIRLCSYSEEKSSAGKVLATLEEYAAGKK